MTLPSPFATKTAIASLSTQNKQQQNKFQSKGSNNNQDSQSQQQQHPIKRNFISFCKYCQEGFSNDTELFQHRRSHAKCPYDECKFNANEATIAIHIQKVHLKQTGLVKIQDLSTPEQIEKWREERRKRYPTTQNVILRQQIQEERQKRGERLNDSKKRFSDGQQKDFVKNMGKRQHDKHENKKNHNNKHNKGNDRNKKFQKRSENLNSEVKDPVPENKLNKDVQPQKIESFKPPAHPQVAKKPKFIEKAATESSDEDEVRPTPKFQGTSKMKDYHTVETSVKEKPALSLLGMYGSDSEDESDVEMESVAENSVIESKNENFEPAGCSVTESPKQEVTQSVDNCQEDEEEDNNDSGPEEVLTIKKDETDSQPTLETEPKSRKRKHNDKHEPKKVIKRSGLDYSKLRNRSINPFLEKLLERDIVHERNVLLQCVNFVVKNNFFGIGQSAEKSGTN